MKLFALLIIVIDGCIDKFPLPDTGFESKTVIFGNINQLPGPYEIQVFRSSALNDNRAVEYERGAVVRIYDNDGNFETLQEVEPGVYHTISLQGVVGKSYYATVDLGSGRKYKSSVQTIPPVVPIEKLYHEFEPDAMITTDQGNTLDALILYVDTEGTEDAQFFRWRWTGIHTVRTYPELHDTLERVPAPLRCSGYIRDPRSAGGIRQVGECKCCICYAYYYSRNAIVSDNRNLDQRIFNKIPLGKIAVVPQNFYEKYFVELEQFGLNEESHDFWKLIEAQQQSTGSLFQPNSVRIQGNLKSTINPHETVLGIFEAVSVNRKSMFIYESDLPYPLAPVVPIGEDCRFTFANATITKPTFW